MRIVVLVLMGFLIGCTGFDVGEISSDNTPPPTPTPIPTPTPTPATVFTVGANTLALPVSSADWSETSPITTNVSTNIVVFIATQDNSTPGTVTDNKGNTYTLAASLTATFSAGSWGDAYFAYYSLGATGGSNHIFTYSAVGSSSSVFVAEFTADQSISLGQVITDSSLQSGANLNLGSVTTTANSSLLLGFAAPGETSNNLNFSWQNGFTNQAENTNNSYWMGSIGTKSVTAGTHNVQTNLVGDVGSDAGGFILEFK